MRGPRLAAALALAAASGQQQPPVGQAPAAPKGLLRGLELPDRGLEQAPAAPKGLLRGLELPDRGLEQVETDFERWQRQLEEGGRLALGSNDEPRGGASTEALLNYSRTMRERLESMGERLGRASAPAEAQGAGRAPAGAPDAGGGGLGGGGPLPAGDAGLAALLGLPPGDLARAAASVRGASGAERSPAAIYATSFAGWLRRSPHQVLLALLALATGLISAWDGPGVWRALFTTAAALIAAGVARFELEALDLAPDQASEGVLAAQAAAAVALATHSGFEGSQVLLGFAVGVAGAYGCGETARAWEGHLPGASALWYTCGAVLGVLVYTVWRRPLLAALGPLCGGLLASSGCGVLLSRACARAGWTGPAVLPPPEAPWLSAAAALAGGQDFLAGHGACALLALAVHGCSEERRTPAVCVLVGCVALTGLAAVGGFECRRHAQDVAACPAWLQPAGAQWQWPVLGCSLWAALAAAAAWRQLGALQAARTLESRGFWSSYWAAALGCGGAQALAGAKAALLRGEAPPDEEVEHLLPPAAAAARAAPAPAAAPPAAAAGRAPEGAAQQGAVAVDARSLALWLASAGAQQHHAAAAAPFAPPGSGV